MRRLQTVLSLEQRMVRGVWGPEVESVTGVGDHGVAYRWVIHIGGTRCMEEMSARLPLYIVVLEMTSVGWS
jgi:hypothetical protein